MKLIVLIGPFPPPIHGMAKNLQIISDELSKQNNVFKLDISPGRIARSLSYHFVKFLKVIKCLTILFYLSITKKISVIYMPPDAGLGSYYSLLFILVSRLFTIPIYLHHRSFLYINQKTFAMRLIVKYQTQKNCHIFLCETMKNEFEKIYGICVETLVVSNAQHVSPLEKPNPSKDVLVIGHLSNLGFEKGLKQVFEVCFALDRLNVNYHLELGGPPENKDVSLYLEENIPKLGKKVTYHGLISKDKKTDFYSRLDVFMFPTQYRNEAQPNVIFEANAYGVPVIAINTGCISTDVDCSNGFVLKDHFDYVEHVPDILIKFAENPEKLSQIKQTTLEKIRIQSRNANASYKIMLTRIQEHVV
jgi:glycosyltransferase involved in cell wall biosynthesis